LVAHVPEGGRVLMRHRHEHVLRLQVPACALWLSIATEYQEEEEEDDPAGWLVSGNRRRRRTR
jgi:hypothetical protein